MLQTQTILQYFYKRWCGFNILQIIIVSKNVLLVMGPY